VSAVCGNRDRAGRAGPIYTKHDAAMESVTPLPEYGRAVRATVIWATWTSSLVVTLALPLVLSGAWGVTTPVSAGETAARLLVSSLGGLFLYGTLRCVALSTAEVFRSPGYPAQHWWVVRRAVRSILRTELALFAFGSGLTVFAVFGHGRLAERAAVAAAVVDGVFVFVSMMTLLGLNDALRHARVVPYFPRKVGEIETYPKGESLARHVAELDEIAASLGLTPLSAFGWNDDMQHELLVWHGSSEGLKTVNALLAFLGSEEMAWDDHVETFADLKRLAHALARADAQDIPFSLLFLHSTATNGREWEVRRGTCF